MSSFKFWTLDWGIVLISQPLEHNTQLCMFLIVSTLVLGLPNCCCCGNEEARADPQIQVYFYSIRHIWLWTIYDCVCQCSGSRGEATGGVFWTGEHVVTPQVKRWKVHWRSHCLLKALNFHKCIVVPPTLYLCWLKCTMVLLWVFVACVHVYCCLVEVTASSFIFKHLRH